MSALIRNYLDQLLKSFKHVAATIDSDTLWKLYNQKDYPAMLGWIKNSMNLDLRVGLRIVESTKPSAPMWIETPQQMPPYGTQAFKTTRVVVNVRRDLLNEKPFGWVVSGFAHELSHVVLFSIGHPLQHEEKAVDLTAMILGYREFVANAEETKTEGTFLSILLAIIMLPLGLFFWKGTSSTSQRLGYLSSDEANFARNYLSQTQAARA